MRRAVVVVLGLVLGLSGHAGAALAEAAAVKGAKAPAWKPTRNAMGQPDLSGYWSNATLTPLTRARSTASARARHARTRRTGARAFSFFSFLFFLLTNEHGEARLDVELHPAVADDGAFTHRRFPRCVG